MSYPEEASNLKTEANIDKEEKKLEYDKQISKQRRKKDNLHYKYWDAQNQIQAKVAQIKAQAGRADYTNQELLSLTESSVRLYDNYKLDEQKIKRKIDKLISEELGLGEPIYTEKGIRNTSLFVRPDDTWKTKSGKNLKFRSIINHWLKIALKQYIKLSLATDSESTTLCRLKAVETFDKYLSQEYTCIQPKEIDREVIINYLNYLIVQKLSPATRAQRLSLLKVFFEVCISEQWLDLQPYLLSANDFPKKYKSAPKFIPDEIIEQIIKKQKKMPKHILPMLLVLMECGMRVSELCSLNKNCLSYDHEGDAFLKRTQTKNREEVLVPISKDLVNVINKQIKFVNEKMGEEFEFLFPTISSNRGKSKYITPRGFRQYLSDFSQKAKLKTHDGQAYHLHPHAFRHTVATQMINKKVPIHFIQRFLGHNSPEMTIRVYAHIHDQTLKKELEKFNDTKIINISGKTIKSATTDTDEENDLAFFKKNVLAQALPNGYCGRPAIRGDCPHANACLTCGDFRTTKEFLSIHKEELVNTQKAIKKASENGWLRQIEMNNKVEANLQKVISSLEDN